MAVDCAALEQMLADLRAGRYTAHPRLIEAEIQLITQTLALLELVRRAERERLDALAKAPAPH